MARFRYVSILAVAISIVAGTTSSIAGSAGASVTATSSHSLTVGVLTDETGLAASANATAVQGVKAGLVLAKRDGYNIKIVTADTATNPTTALTAAKELVQQDHATAIITHSALTFSAAPFLKTEGIPVVGPSLDADEWNTDTNMFSIYGPYEVSLATTTMGNFFKLEGVKDIGAIGYSISPSSSGFAKSVITSAQHAGLNAPYLNTTIPLGDTNGAPIALAMKNDKIDGFAAAVDPNTGFAIVSSLRQLGDNPKVAVLGTGYGGDLKQAGPGALQEAQDVYFQSGYEPVELNTPATKQFVSDLRAAGIHGDPTYAEYNAYVSVGLLVAGLKKAGNNLTSASIMKGLSSIHSWNALGLWGGRSMDINNRHLNTVGIDNCLWMTKLVGSSFKPVPGASPVCGKTLPATS